MRHPIDRAVSAFYYCPEDHDLRVTASRPAKVTFRSGWVYPGRLAGPQVVRIYAFSSASPRMLFHYSTRMKMMGRRVMVVANFMCVVMTMSIVGWCGMVPASRRAMWRSHRCPRGVLCRLVLVRPI